MGVSYEINWYLVVADYDAIKETEEKTFYTVKSESRIYPIESIIPLIIKKVGCVAFVRILEFAVNKDETTVEFEYVEKIDHRCEIAKHYDYMYEKSKNRSMKNND